MTLKQTERQRQNSLHNMGLGRIRGRHRHRHHPRNPLNDFGESPCARCITTILCKIPCVIVCFICGGDTYLLFGYSRLVLWEEIGEVFTSIVLIIFSICMTLLLTSYFRCMLTSCAVKDNPPPPDFDVDRCPKCNKCGNLVI